jgi:endonuclease-3 related protein
MSSKAELLMEMYRAMREQFGHRSWWPTAQGSAGGERKLEVCLGAILTQNTSWTNVLKAFANLRAAGLMSVEALHAKPPAELADVLHPVGYYNVKAKRVKNFIARVCEAAGGDIGAFLDRSVAALREELLSINGIGRETADCIVLYAAGKPTFVVDAYTARIGVRHFLLSPEDDYEAIKELFESALPEDVDLYNDYHAQLVQTGKKYCRTVARCEGCPLESLPHDRHAGRE